MRSMLVIGLLCALLTPTAAAQCRVLTAPEWRSDGSSMLLRGMWWRDGANVRHKAERSTDGGRTWAPLWGMVFRPHRAG
jgi:hypothetical protein